MIKADPSKFDDIELAAIDVREAYQNYKVAWQAEDTARRNVTACQNALNKAQKRFDEASELMKGQNKGKNTEWDTDKGEVTC